MSSTTTKTVEELHAAEMALSDRLILARGELADARDRDAESVLNAALNGDRETDDAALVAGMAREKEAATIRAITQVRGLRAEAIRAEWATEAAALRDQADAKRAEFDTRMKKTNALLDQLKEFEGCIYVPLRPNDGITGINVYGDPAGMIRIPTSQGIANEAAALDHMAQQVTRRTIAAAGEIVAPTIDELIDRVRAWDPRKFAPAMHLVADWIEGAKATAQRCVDGLPIPEQRAKSRIRFVFHWHDGQIVDGRCGVDIDLYEPLRDGKHVVDSWDPPRRLKVSAAGVVELDTYRDRRPPRETELAPGVWDVDITA